MKNISFALFCLFLSVSLFAGIGGNPAHQGRITSIETKDQLTLATVRMSSSASLAKDAAEKVKPGMSVRLIYSIDTAQFRPGIGRVLEVRDNGDVIVSVDKALLKKEITGPNSAEPVRVEDLFRVGADVSISNEAL